MKTALRIFGLVSFAMLPLLLETCMLASVSINDRISLFVSSLNSDRSTTNENLDPQIVAPTPGGWDSFFGTSFEPYAYSPDPPTTYSSSDAETVITGSGGSHWGPYLYKFVMVNVGTTAEDWRIHSLWISNGSGGWNPVF